MHHHHWDSWLHFPLASLWMSMPWWIEFIDKEGRLITFAIGVVIGGLQIAYLIRKHIRFGK
jgi:hypothetical protein